MVTDANCVLARLADTTVIAADYGRALCDIGPKYGGTPGETAARGLILSALRLFGFAPTIEPFDYLRYTPHSATVAVTRPLREVIAAEPLQFAATAGAEGEAVYVGDGSAAQYARLTAYGVSIRGKVVITTGWPPFLLYHLAEDHGAAGYVVITRPPENLIAVGSAVLESRRGTIPGATIGSEDGHRLLALLSAGTVQLRLSSMGEFTIDRSENLLVEISGSAEPTEKVVICSHYDSQCKGAHAWDNVSGDIALIAIAHAVADFVPKRTLQLYFCGVEEQGMLSGSRAFVTRHAQEMPGYAGLVNLDGLSSVLCPRNIIQGTPGALQYAQSVAHQQGWTVHRTPPLEANSDHFPFVEAGVPAIWVHEGPRSPYQHTEADVFEHLDIAKLLRTAAVGAQCALDLARRPELAFPRSSPLPSAPHANKEER